jgi:NAD(P)H-quinone oxidoreductase subunit 5
VDIAFLLLLTHAVSKALLAMSVGSIIITTNNQNVTELGGLWSRMPATTTAFIVGTASLVVVLPIGTFWTMQRWVNGLWDIPWWLLGLLMFVNCFSAINLIRIFRLVFLGPIREKTRRAPEVTWPMAVPMVALSGIVLSISLAPVHWPLWLSPVNPQFNNESTVIQVALPLIIASGLVGCWIGSQIHLKRSWARSIRTSTRLVQDLLAYDFYIERIYELTIVWAVQAVSEFSSWIDRYIVDGFVNFVGLATVFSGQSLKYSASGQSQSYVLTIVVGLGLLLVLVGSVVGIISSNLL